MLMKSHHRLCLWGEGATAATIGAVGSLFAAAGTAAANYGLTEHARKRNFELNEQAAENADARTRALYNDLYSPSAQMRDTAKGIQENGLSPSLIYSNGVSGSSGSSPSGALSQGSAGLPPSSFDLNSAVADALAAAQIRNVEANTEKTVAETNTIEGENARGKAEIDNIIESTKNTYLKSETEALDAILKNFEVAIKGETGQIDVEIRKLDLSKLSSEISNLVATLHILEIDGRIKRESADSIIKYYHGQVVEQTARIFNTYADTALKKANIKLTNEQCKKIVNDILVDNQNVEISKRRVTVDEKALLAQVEQWCIQNNLTERSQRIEIAKVVLNFINESNGNFIRALDALVPF